MREAIELTYKWLTRIRRKKSSYQSWKDFEGNLEVDPPRSMDERKDFRLFGKGVNKQPCNYKNPKEAGTVSACWTD